jgi:hypothetical protein
MADNQVKSLFYQPEVRALQFIVATALALKQALRGRLQL